MCVLHFLFFLQIVIHSSLFSYRSQHLLVERPHIIVRAKSLFRLHTLEELRYRVIFPSIRTHHRTSAEALFFNTNPFVSIGRSRSLKTGTTNCPTSTLMIPNSCMKKKLQDVCFGCAKRSRRRSEAWWMLQAGQALSLKERFTWRRACYLLSPFQSCLSR